MALTDASPSELETAQVVTPTAAIERFMADFGTRYAVEDVERLLVGARDLRVLVVGEAIIDEYVYCETIGKAGKEPILAARYLSREKFVGGILAVANHVAAICDGVTCLTFLGDDDSHEEFIRERMNSKVELSFLEMRNAPTLVKRRYIESYPLQKLFELYVMAAAADDPTQAAALVPALEAALGDYDVVIVADYGHGMINADSVQTLASRSRFLAVNTQMNAHNRGFNTVSKYPRADFVSVSEVEIRLEARSRQRDLREIVVEVAEKLSVQKLLVTRGGHGCLVYDRDEGFAEAPAFTTHVVDRVGAGDALLSVAALCVAQGAPAELVAAVGNAVGAQAVASVGNSAAIDPQLLLREFAALLPA